MEDWVEVTSGRPSFGLVWPVEKVSRQYFMARMPLMVPVSYLARSARERKLERSRKNIPKQHTSEGDEETDDNGRRGRADGIVGLLQCEAHVGYILPGWREDSRED